MSNLLQRLLLENAVGGAITSSTVHDWSSVTFTGSKHQICLQFNSEVTAENFELAVKDERIEIDLKPARQMCADIQIVEADPNLNIVTVEIVTLNE